MLREMAPRNHPIVELGGRDPQSIGDTVVVFSKSGEVRQRVPWDDVRRIQWTESAYSISYSTPKGEVKLPLGGEDRLFFSGNFDTINITNFEGRTTGEIFIRRKPDGGWERVGEFDIDAFEISLTEYPHQG